MEAAELARVLREQQALPLTVAEAEDLARALETSGSDEAFLANVLRAVRLIAQRLELSAADDGLTQGNRSQTPGTPSA